jgi:hypothetical protein
MATEKQILANRKNALKSCGPKTIPGKIVSSRNSTTHGFYTTNLLLPDEDHQEFVRMGRRFVAAYMPTGSLQADEVKTIIETTWQLHRANRVDAELYQIYGFYEGAARGVGTAFAQDATEGNAFSKLVRYQAFLGKKLQTAEKKLSELKAREGVPQPTVRIVPPATQAFPTAVVATAAEFQQNGIGALDILKWLKGVPCVEAVQQRATT